LEALAVCQRHKATLLMARLDRLARNVAFISNLMESRVDFVAVDMPEANRLTIHILAAVAEHEREMISKRTKAALQVAKARTNLKAQTEERHATVRPLLKQLQEQGYSLSAIAQELNRRNVSTARGGLWYATTVRNILIER
jgi:DNA invertase Pin-like site-specific DNA recombinase